MEFPRVVTYADSDREADAAAVLARTIAELGIEAPYVLHSRQGEVLIRGLPGVGAPERNPGQADQQWAFELGSRARRAGTDAVVAVGGGRCIDVAKLAAARAGVQLVAVPTQPSHDGICSPVAVVPNADGTRESIGAIAPVAVFVSIPTLARAPLRSARAGLGDLLANPFALRDWALAAQRGLEETDGRAWELSVRSYELIRPTFEAGLDDDGVDVAFVARLAEALVLSGLAMICAGTSRPASGAEHEVSHAIDELFQGRAHHGAQVAFGCIVSAALYEEDVRRFRSRLRAAGLPDHPADLGLDLDDMVATLLHAPHTRPGRFTALEDADLEEATARSLVKGIWADG